MRKTSSLLNHLLPVIFLILFAIGCKKTDSNSANPIQIENAKKEIEKQILKSGGLSQKIEVKPERLSARYADLNGNILSFSNLRQMGINSVCADDLPDYFDLSYYYRLYQCGVGYQIKFGFMTSWDDDIVLVNPYNSSNKTKGTVKISIPGNSNAYNESTYNVQIINLGADPNLPSNNIFYVLFETTTLVPVDLVNTPGAVLRLGAYIASDCSSLDNYQIAPMSTSGFGFSTPLNNDPCTRNDKAWFQLPGAVGYRQIGIFGYDPTGICSYDAGSAPSLQETQYSLNNGVTWNDFVNTSASPSAGYYGSRYVYRWDFGHSATLAVGTYNIQIRYRNIKYNSGVTGFPLPSSSNACGNNSFNTPVWTVESFPGVVVN